MLNRYHPIIHQFTMETTSNIIRRSIHVFLKFYHYYTSIAALLVLPLGLMVLLSQAIVSSLSPFMTTTHARIELLFGAAGFPSSQFFSFLNLKVSQTICSSIFTLPFTLVFLLLGKAVIIRSLSDKKSPVSIFTLYNSLVNTHLCNLFIILSANASAFVLFFLGFNAVEAFGFSSRNLLLFASAAGAILYSVILANAYITCNLAMIVAGMESCDGYLAVLKACVLIKGRASTALTLALPVNFGLAALEALFQYRVVRAYRLSDKLTSSMALEGLLVAYLYSLLIVIDTIATCIFYKSCKSSARIEEDLFYRIALADEENNGYFKNSKTSHELP